MLIKDSFFFLSLLKLRTKQTCCPHFQYASYSVLLQHQFSSSFQEESGEVFCFSSNIFISIPSYVYNQSIWIRQIVKLQFHLSYLSSRHFVLFFRLSFCCIQPIKTTCLVVSFFILIIQTSIEMENISTVCFFSYLIIHRVYSDRV